METAGMDDAQELAGLLAEREIHRVLMRYARGIDRRDFALVASCYRPGATGDHGSFKGPVEDFVAWVPGALERFDTTMHFLGNVLIDLNGPAPATRAERWVAHVETYCVAYHRLRGVDVDSIAGLRYVDRFERRDGSWRIADRCIVVEWNRRDEVDAPGFGPDYLRGTHDRSDPVYRNGASSG